MYCIWNSLCGQFHLQVFDLSCTKMIQHINRYSEAKHAIHTGVKYIPIE